MELACHKARSFGCVDPDEQPVKWLLALLMKLHFGGELPDALSKYRKFNDLKSIFLTEEGRRHNVLVPPPLVDYPQCAADMPDSIISCFGDQLPITRDTSSEITGLASIAKAIPLRKTSALLKGTAPHEFDDIALGTALSATSRSSCARGRAVSSHTSLESSPSPKCEPEVKLEATPAAEKHPRNFCPSCGHHLHSVCSHAAPIKQEQPDKSDEIRKKLRINGQPLHTPIHAALAAPVEPPKPPSPPELDDHALAAIEAMQNRKEARKAAALEAKNGEVQADAAPDDADDNDDNDDIMKKPAGVTLDKRVMKRPGMKNSVIGKNMKDVIKRPGIHDGCMKCRGHGCATCANPFFGGKRVTRTAWLKLNKK
jgi:hypothetical protein